MTGLSAAEAAARLKAEGFNELPRAGRRSIVRLIAGVLLSSSLVEAFTRSNRTLILVTIFIAVVLSLSLTWPPVAGLFRFGPLHGDDLAITVGAALLSLGLLEISKFPLRHALRRK